MMNSGTKHLEDTSKTIEFFFEGRSLAGHPGEPLAKALFRAGIHTLSYSIKYHRPRSIHCARGRCSMCHVEVNGIPGVPACTTPLEAGMQVKSENFKPFYASILGRIAGKLPLPAGFYYRTFTRPAFLRNIFMRRLRSMAGVGRVLPYADGLFPGRACKQLENLSASYDVIVVGAGLSGMAAALAAARNGTKVLLADEYWIPAGHALGYQHDKELEAGRDELVDGISSSQQVSFSPGTTAYGFYCPDILLLGNHRGMRRVTARSFIFATGGYDVVPLFENNDIPGIFGARAMRLFLERDGFIPGKRAVVYGSGRALADITELLEHRGIAVSGIADAGDEANPDRTGTGDVPFIRGAKLIKVHGRHWVSRASFAPASSARPLKRTTLACDILCIAFKGQPAYELPFQAGFRFELSSDLLEENRVMLPAATRMTDKNGISFFIAGEAAGERDWKQKIAQGQSIGEEAALHQTSPNEGKLDG